MQYRFKRVAVKIGSNVLTGKDGMLDTERMASLVAQIAELHKNGVEVILVSSGAVASGRGELHLDKKIDAVKSRQLFSAVGQVKLLNNYYELFAKHGIRCGQVLTMKECFSTRRLYLNQKQCIEVMLENKVIPIVNENDTVAVTELMFTDNDELSGLMATMMDMEALVILSNIDGIYNGNPADEGTFVIREITENDRDLSRFIQTKKSSFGRGGMITKTNIARKVAKEGITVIIANGTRENILPDLLKEGSDVVCTTFTPSQKEISSIKKWIAHSDGYAKGTLVINEKAQAKLLSDEAVSLLPIGVVSVEGEFEKDDIVKIVTADGVSIGVGKVSCDSAKARSVIGNKGGRALVHYDYLFLE
ncbi:MAG: glutamate 5-kinase [Muribaculaceae bacterium]|nr:glutamate 5-kinase [Muribaculaceae bacterium]